MGDPWEKPPIMVGCCTSGLDADMGDMHGGKASRVNKGLIEQKSHTYIALSGVKRSSWDNILV